MASSLTALVPKHWKRRIRERLLPLRFRHISGPKHVVLADDEAAVTCVLKNGEYYLNAFVEHYTRLGFRHIFFLDNGSTDVTVAMAGKHDNVSVYQCDLPIEANQGAFKKCLAELVVPSGWCLDADIDEFFDYPFSTTMDLSQFLQYLNRRQFSAVIAQMLDLFSDKPLSALAEKASEEDLRAQYRYYDLSQVTKIDYRASPLARTYASENRLHGEHRLYFGGIRKALFGLDCLLTKHSLFRTGAGIDLFPHVHFVNKGSVADVSCVLLHYKLVSNAVEVASKNSSAFTSIRKGYEDLINLVETKPTYRIKTDTAVALGGVEDLIENDFLYVSAEFRNYVRTAPSRSVGLPGT